MNIYLEAKVLFAAFTKTNNSYKILSNFIRWYGKSWTKSKPCLKMHDITATAFPSFFLAISYQSSLLILHGLIFAKDKCPKQG